MNALLSQLVAQEEASPLASLPLLLVLGGGFIYLMVLGPRKEKKRKAELLASLRVGNEVVTTGGIYGTITFLEDNVAHIQVDTDVVIRVSKAALARREGATDDADAVDDDENVVDSDDDDEVVELIDVGDPDPETTPKRGSSAKADKSTPK